MTKENTEIAYKVVREDNGAWKSAIIEGKACVTYALGQRSFGFEGTPVTVFLSWQRASTWRLSNVWQILEGQAGNPRPQAELAALGWGHRLRTFRSFWKRGDKYQGETFAAPAGTYAADWFEPEKVVPR